MSRPTTRGIFVKERLAEAREARGLTQKDVSRSIGKGESTVSNWERGGQAPEPIALPDLADALGVYPSYFLKPMPDHGDTPIFFRSLAIATVRARTREKAKVRWLQHISMTVQEVLDLPEINIPEPIQGQDYLKLKTEDLETIASDVRSFWDLGEGPIKTMVLVAENAGIVVGVDETGSTAIDGQGTWSAADGRPYILLATDKYTAYRRQMDVAHELSHLILHRFVKEDDLIRNFELIERQAKYLAGAILLPPRSFAAELPSLSLDGFLSLKRRWMTSIGAMIMRAEHLELISSDMAASLWRYRTTRGWNRKEPYDLPDETTVEQPCLLRRCLELIIEEGGRSKSALLETDIGLGAGDIEMLTALPPRFFAPDSAPVIRLEPKLRGGRDDASNRAAEVVQFRRST